MLKNLFPLPLWIEQIDPSTYNKTQIIEDVYHNYNIDPLRDNFGNNFHVPCMMHHENRDHHNEKFKTLNYRMLKVVYQNAINRFLEYNFDVTSLSNEKYYCDLDMSNYTAMTKNNHMGTHEHASSQFVGVHYVQFDKELHNGIRFWNPNNQYVFCKVFESYDYFVNGSIHNKFYVPDIKEDTLVIFPGYLEHDVPPQPDIDSDKLRISIAFNFNLVRRDV